MGWYCMQHGFAEQKDTSHSRQAREGWHKISLATQNSVRLKIYEFFGLPWWSMVKNLPVNGGKMNSIPYQGRPTCDRATKPMHHNY